MEIAICDDEEAVQKKLKQLIKKNLPQSRIAVYDSGQQLLKSQEEYDIVFLDICMAELDGIETAKILRQSKDEIILIFITGVKDYVFEAFDVSAFHYLLKPIAEEKFASVLKRAAAEVKKRAVSNTKQLFIKTKQRNVTICLKDIIYIESQRRKVEIHTIKEKITAYAVMKELEIQLDSRFYRCHRGYLVNMAYIREYQKDSIFLANGEWIYLSKEKYGDFVKSYMHYLKKGGAAHV
ncbi:MAG: response regulator transcription factor [Lachnospiraceae bacterium]|nr:response regulator transcription factor [Lachnospiraceae bacterium]